MRQMWYHRMTIVDDFLNSGDAAWQLDKEGFNEAALHVENTICYLVYTGSYFILNRSKINGIKVVKAGNGTGQTQSERDSGS